MTTAENRQHDCAAGQITRILKQYWGYDQLRPLQGEAIEAGISRQDSLVVMPTGGGKSLCFQIPPLVMDRTDIVVSPLIALMKDQVDGLRAAGYPAAAMYTGQSVAERNRIEADLNAGKYKLLYVSPERLVNPGFLRRLAALNIQSFAIDEAHCISHWGHDFRAEYRQLATIRDYCPNASIHAFTATATGRVRQDIIDQLGLQNPRVLIGDFDRPNLIYRILPRAEAKGQILETVRKHKNEAVIIYCISRAATEGMASHLQQQGIHAKYYHAGMTPEDRHKVQDAFAREDLNVVVATVAFGMGIDRSNVRCVIHAGMPKSIEHYQQETGRAGRDGLASECVLLYSLADAMKWENIMARGAHEAGFPLEAIEGSLTLLHEMRSFCNQPRCRHKALVEHFGQKYEKENCGSCDMCLGDVEGIENATVTAQKILSCIFRVEQRFGAGHVAEVLHGAKTQGVVNREHDALSTWGLLKDIPKNRILSLIYQLLDQELISRSEGEYPTLQLNDTSWEILRGHREVFLMQESKKKSRRTAVEAASWQDVDERLFEQLRFLRHEMATDHDLPPYIIFNDETLRDLARRQPTTLPKMLDCKGIGEKKLARWGKPFLAEILKYKGIDPSKAESHTKKKLKQDRLKEQFPEPEYDESTPYYIEPDEPADCFPPPPLYLVEDDAPPAPKKKKKKREKRPKPQAPTTRSVAFEFFDNGTGIDEVADSIHRSRSRTLRYLLEYIEERQPETLDAWVTSDRYTRIAEVAEETGTRRLNAIIDQLEDQATEVDIRLVTRHLEVIDNHRSK